MANGTTSPELFENLRLELRRGCLIVAVLAQLRTEQYGLRAIAKVSTIADFDEFMKAHGDEAKALWGTPDSGSGVRPAALS